MDNSGDQFIVNVKQNRIPVNTNPLPFGNAVNIIYSGDSAAGARWNFAKGRLKMTLNFLNTNGNPVTIVRPTVAWITNYTATITYKLGGGRFKNILYTGQNGRGDAGYIWTILTRSAPNFSMQTFPEVLQPRTVSGTQTEESVPLMFLLDFAASNRWMPIQLANLTLNFAAANQIFFCPNAPNFQPQVTNYWLEFPTGDAIQGIPRELSLPDPRRTYVQFNTYLTGIQNINVPLDIPGKPLCVFYWFELQTPATSTSPPVYNFNPNPFSFVTLHQILIGGHQFPINPNYLSVYDSSGNNTGTSSHYDELLVNIGKYMPNQNTILTYDDWLNNFRIYSILINDTSIFNTIQLPLVIQLSQPLAQNAQLYVATQYLPTEKF